VSSICTFMSYVVIMYIVFFLSIDICSAFGNILVRLLFNKNIRAL
jgi:hypothetical protein